MKPFRFVMIFNLMLLTAGLQAGQFAIVGGTVIPVEGDTLYNGTVIIAGDRIESVGDRVDIPAGAEVIDASGLFVYPGLIDAFTRLGLMEIWAVAATGDVNELGDYNPHIRAITAINPHSVHIPITRVNGISTALAAPGGGVISGQCALINLSGDTPSKMAVKDPAALLINFPRMPDPRALRRQTMPSKKDPVKKAKEKLDDLYRLFDRAARYGRSLKSDGTANPDLDPMLDALQPALEREVPVIITVSKARDIKNAVAFADSLNIKAIFHGVNDGWRVAPLLKEHEIPVLLGPVLSSPGRYDPYDARFANAAVLSRAGVKFAFTTGSNSDVRSLPYHAGSAAAFGLAKEEALKGVTLYPAQILGVDSDLGSLKAGKLANVIVTDGDPLEMKTRVRHLFIGGDKVSLESKHLRLYEQFKNR